MPQKNNTSLIPDKTEISIGVSILCTMIAVLLIGKLGYQIQILAACTGAVMCTQEGSKASFKAGLTRILGVIAGGLTGVALVALDDLIQIPVLFCFMTGVGILVNITLCKLLKLPAVQARVSCMTLLLTVLVLSGPARFNYALGRLIGTLFGAVISLLVSFLFEKVFQRKDK